MYKSFKKRSKKTPLPTTPSIENIDVYVEGLGKALLAKQEHEMTELQAMLSQRKISEKSFKKRKLHIERWVEAKRRKIETTKSMLVQGWMQARQIMDTLAQEKLKMAKLLDS